LAPKIQMIISIWTGEWRKADGCKKAQFETMHPPWTGFCYL